MTFAANTIFIQLDSLSKMAVFRNLKKYLGYGGDGQPVGPDINHDRTGLHVPPTHRELLDYAVYLNDSFNGGGAYPKDQVIK